MSASVGNAITVRGSSDCGQWLQRQEDGVKHVYDIAWLVAYLSGISIGAGIEFWDRPSGSVSPDQVHVWMNNYCQANPLKDVSDGAMVLFYEVTLE
jgi:hypothetical protein